MLKERVYEYGFILDEDRHLCCGEPVEYNHCLDNCPRQSHCDTHVWASDEHMLSDGEAWLCECGNICKEEECYKCGAKEDKYILVEKFPEFKTEGSV